MTPLLRAFYITAVLGLLIWGLTDVRRRAETDPARPGAHRTDFTVYTEAGAAFFDGRNPYAVTNPRGWHYLYPPLFALLVTPLHPLPTQWQGVAWFILSLLMAGGCLYECRAILRALQQAGATVQDAWREGRLWIILGAFAAILIPFLDTLQRGQVGVAILWPLLLGFRLVIEKQDGLRSFLGGLILALPVVIKATPALPVCILLVRLLSDAAQGRQWAWHRFTRASAGVMAGLLLFFLLVPAAVIGWTDNLTHLETWYRTVASNKQVGPDQDFNVTSYRNQSLANAVLLLGQWLDYRMDEGLAAPAVTAVRACLVLLLLLVAARGRPGPEPLGLAAVFGLACAVTLPLSPISWGHHFIILLPALLLVPLAVQAKGHHLAAKILASSAAVLLLVHYVSFEVARGIIGSLGLLGIAMAGWCLAAAVLLVWDRAPRAPAVTPVPVAS